MKQVLSSFHQLVEQDTAPPIHAITTVNHSRYNVTWDDIVKRDRDKPRVVMLRRMVSKLFRDLGYSYSSIGKVMQRDHGTVMHNVKVMNGMLDVYPEVIEEWKDYKTDVSNKISDPKRSE